MLFYLPGPPTLSVCDIVNLEGSGTRLHGPSFKRLHRVSYRIFFVGGRGEEVCGALLQCRAQACSTRVLAYVQARGVWGHARPGNFFRSSQIASVIWDKVSSYYFDDTYLMCQHQIYCPHWTKTHYKFSGGGKLRTGVGCGILPLYETLLR